MAVINPIYIPWTIHAGRQLSPYISHGVSGFLYQGRLPTSPCSLLFCQDTALQHNVPVKYSPGFQDMLSYPEYILSLDIQKAELSRMLYIDTEGKPWPTTNPLPASLPDTWVHVNPAIQKAKAARVPVSLYGWDCIQSQPHPELSRAGFPFPGSAGISYHILTLPSACILDA